MEQISVKSNNTSSKPIFRLELEELKNYNVMIDGQNFLMYGNIQKIVTGQGDDYTTSSLLDYSYFNKYYKMIAIDLIRQQALDADPKVMQQIKIAGNLNSDEDVNDNTTTMFFINEESKETILDF